MISINKLRKRGSISNTNNTDDVYNQFIEDYQFYFDNALNKTKYKDKYNDSVTGDCIIMDVSEYNQKNGDEKWITTLPNSGIELFSVISLDFAKSLTDYWIVEDKEDLIIPSHDKYKISPLYHLGTLQRYGTNDIEIDTKVMDSDNDTTVKKIFFSPKVFNVQRGDILLYNEANKTYLVKEVQNFTGYPFANAEECNHLLKWMIDGQLYKSMCIVVKSTRFTLGTKVESAGIVEGDGVYSIVLPYNDITKTIHDNQRFIFNNEAWKTTKTDFTTVSGLLTIFLTEDSINTEIDDVLGEIAGAFVNKHTYIYDIPASIDVEKDKSINLVYSIKDELGNDFDYSLVTVINKSNLIQVDNNKGVISIKGLDIGTGSITLSVPSGEVSKEFTVNFNVESVVADKIDYKVTTSNGYTYRIKEGSTISIDYMKNGVVDNSSLVIDYSLDSIGQTLLSKDNIAITKKTNNSLQIRNVNISTPMSFTITITDKANGTVILTQVINLKGA